MSGIDLTFSVSVPTMIVVKSMKFGPVSLGVKFLISVSRIQWFPVIGPETEEEALEILKSRKDSIYGPKIQKSVTTVDKLPDIIQ